MKISITKKPSLKAQLLAASIIGGAVTLGSPSSAEAENLNLNYVPIAMKNGNIVAGIRARLRATGRLESSDVENDLGDLDAVKDVTEILGVGYVEAYAALGRSRVGNLAASIGLNIDSSADGDVITEDNVRLRLENASRYGRLIVGHIEGGAAKNFGLNPALVGLASLDSSGSADFTEDLGVSIGSRVSRWDYALSAKLDQSVRAQISTDRIAGNSFYWAGFEAAYEDEERLALNGDAIESRFQKGLEVAGVLDVVYGSTKVRGRAELSTLTEDVDIGEDIATSVGLAVSHQWDRLSLAAGVNNTRHYENDVREVSATVGAEYAVGTNIKLVGGVTYSQVRDLNDDQLVGEQVEDELVAEGGVEIMF